VGNMRILFVCSGNMCRSPMAEGLARKILGSIVEAESAGTGAMNGRGAAKNAIEIMRSRFDIDLSKHRSRNVSDVALDDFDYIVPMDDDVADELRGTYPQISSRIMESWKIDDPFGGSLEAYGKTADEIQKRVEELSLHIRDKSA
jgi:protein-tyrosine-phosphatase